MTQAERRLFLIRSLMKEKTEYRDLSIPAESGEQKRLLRSLMNVRAPAAADGEFLRVQDDYLRQELAEGGITDVNDLTPVSGDLYLWQGDITRLRCGAIVNAANSGMTGCYIPCHACIDNCIHTYAGVQLRLDCAQLMAEQGREEPTGQAKITRAYNLPCDYVIHTVGPIVEGRVTREDRRLLASCYQDAPGPVYDELLALLADKDYFVITTNVDHCFQKAGFDKKRLFYTQGDYGLFQCSRPCCRETFDNETVIREMAARQENMRVPAERLPRCPHCGRPMAMNLRCDDTFVQDEGWYAAAEQYEDFLRTRKGQKLLFWELGVGYNTPVIIKYPFWQMTAKNPQATYACVNLGQAAAMCGLEERAILIDGDIGAVVHALREEKQAVLYGGVRRLRRRVYTASRRPTP